MYVRTTLIYQDTSSLTPSNDSLKYHSTDFRGDRTNIINLIYAHTNYFLFKKRL